MYRYAKTIMKVTTVSSVTIGVMWLLLQKYYSKKATSIRQAFESWFRIGSMVQEMTAQLRQVNAVQLSTQQQITDLSNILDNMKAVLDEEKERLRSAESMLHQFRNDQHKQAEALSSIENLVKSSSSTAKLLTTVKEKSLPTLPDWQRCTNLQTQTECTTVDCESSSELASTESKDSSEKSLDGVEEIAEETKKVVNDIVNESKKGKKGKRHAKKTGTQ